MGMIQLKQSPQLNTFLSGKVSTPRCRPQETARISNRLYAAVSLFEDRLLNPEDIKSLSKALATELGKCKASAFVSALQYFTTQPLTKEFLRFFCGQAAASRFSLRRSAPFDLFRGALGFEWAPFKVVDVIQDDKDHSHHLMLTFTDGRAYGIPVDLKRTTVGTPLYREAGIPWKLLRGVQLHPKDLVGFRFMALLQYDPYFPFDFDTMTIKRLSRHSIAAIRCTGSQAQSNKLLFEERTSPCPFKMTSPCAQCFIGYDTCPRGCRSETNWAAMNKPSAEILINGKRNRQN